VYVYLLSVLLFDQSKMQTPLERVTKDIEKVEKKIENAEVKMNKYQEMLKAATGEFEYKKANDLY
jgi:peptidoglycan hydrolase CwlO-like protein